MKKALLIAAIVTTASALAAQETTVSVLVKEDGKVVKDTTYAYDSAEDAEHAMRILGLISEGNGQDKHFRYVMKEGSNEVHTGGRMVFISEDGEKHLIHGDSVVWHQHGDHNCKHVKVMKVHVDEDADHDCDGEKVMVKKEVKVIVESDEDGDWSVVETEVEQDTDEDAEVIIIKKKQKKSKKQ